MAPPHGDPPLSRSYSANVVTAILALFPGLINTSAVALLAPRIGTDLHVPSNLVAALPLFGDAALAFGCVAAAEVSRRVEGRRWFVWLMAASLLCSLAAAAAPTFPILLAAHVAREFVAGMLFIATLPPLLITFGAKRLPTTANVLVPALFGATTLGPLLAAACDGAALWRWIFVGEALAAIVALALGLATIARRDPPAPETTIDAPALWLSGIGATLIFAGIGRAAADGLRDPAASGPLAAGLVAFVVLLVREWRLGDGALVPVRPLLGSLAFVGTIATMAGSAGFSATQQSVTLALQRAGGLSIAQTGLALWPEAVAAIVAGFVFARLVTTRWVVVTGAAGVVLIGIGALIARTIALDARGAGIVVFLTGLGAALSVTPGLFLVTLSFERPIVGRAIALLNLLRLTLGFMSAPGVEYTIGSRASSDLARAGVAAADPVSRAYIVGRPLPATVPAVALRTALEHGLGEAFTIVVAIAALAVVAIAVVLLRARVRFRAPDMAAFDAGKPALESPPVR